MDNENLITIVDLLLRDEWMIDLLPGLRMQIKDLTEVDPDYELTNSGQYIEKVCTLFPKIFDSFCTLEDLSRRENLVKNCFSLSSYNDPNTITLLQIMASNCNTCVYNLCEKLSKQRVVLENISKNERLIIDFLFDKGLVIKLSEEDCLLCCLSWLGEDFVALLN